MAKINFAKISRGGTIANNTVARLDSDGTISIELHGHPIFKIRDHGYSFTLAGYGTVTTRDRVNQFIRHYIPGRIYVHQKDWAQYLNIDGTPHGLDESCWADVDAESGTLMFADHDGQIVKISI